MDIRIVIAAIGAAASVLAAAVAFILKVGADARDRRRRAFSHLMALRSEILVNMELARLMLRDQRLAGLRFTDRVWSLPDTSFIYERSLPWADVLAFYAYVALTNAFIDRQMIADKYPDDVMKAQFARERVEAMVLVAHIEASGPDAARAIEKRTRLTSDMALNLTDLRPAG
jgi:hypothetical protein